MSVDLRLATEARGLSNAVRPCSSVSQRSGIVSERLLILC
jgi:hypothetical protein